MHPTVFSVLVLSLVIVVCVEAQFNYYFRDNNYPGRYYFPNEYYPGQHYFRDYLNSLQPYFKAKNSLENRSLISTLTITIATSTYTTFITTSTTCTTSTSWLKSCSPSKGRRRRSQKDISSLLFKEDDEIEDFDADIFFSKSRLLPENPIIPGGIEHQVPGIRQQSTSSPVPVMIQPGFQAPDYMQSARFLLAFGTATVTTTQTSTYSFILTAKCNSSTGFLVCGYTGK